MTRESMVANGALDSFAVGSLLVERQWFAPTMTEIVPLIVVVVFSTGTDARSCCTAPLSPHCFSRCYNCPRAPPHTGVH